MSASGIIEVRRIGKMGQGGLSSRRVELSPADGTANACPVVCFLPWLFSFSRARDAGLILPQTTLAYEMPHAIVSSDPEMSVEALQVVARDFSDFVEQRRLDPANVTLVGLSIGNFAATYIANQMGTRLCAISAGDRGESLIWSSSLASQVRRQAETNGLSYADFENTLRDYNPINNLLNIRPGSTFIAGYFDKIVPFGRSKALMAQARTEIKTIRNVVLPFDHAGTLYAGVKYLRYRGLVGRSFSTQSGPTANLDIAPRASAQRTA